MTGAKPAISVGQYSVAGRKDRNDDSYGVAVPDGVALQYKGIAMAIADGMSSSDRAKMASETCVKTFLDDYFSTHETWTVKKSAALVLKSVNSWLSAQTNSAKFDGSDLVTTFSGAILKSGMLHVFHVGDTRISLVRNGSIEPLTSDHRVDVGREKNFLTRAMGVKTDVEIDYRAETVEAGDLIVFTTDGIHEFLSSAELAAHLKSDAGLDDIAKAVSDHAYANGSHDNLTCQIVRIDHPGRQDSDAHYAALRALPFPPELEPGMVFEGYRIVRELHTSKRTQVYLAVDADTTAMAVIKTPSVNFEDDPTYLEMFTREEWIGRIISSPHVLNVLQPKNTRRFQYYVTEYFEGQTLRQWMQQHPLASLEAVRPIIEQIAVGLRAFHRKDVIHQDLKPENVMIDSKGLVKIIDFGSSRAASQAEDGSDSQSQGLVGTIDYTAPEYHLGHVGTNRSDIYALGVIGYEMLVGKLPYGKGFAGKRDVARLSYVSARDHRDDLPIWVDDALAKAVAKDPDARTEALSALIEDLKRPSASFEYARPTPLIEKNPLKFWQVLAIALLIGNVLQLMLSLR